MLLPNQHESIIKGYASNKICNEGYASNKISTAKGRDANQRGIYYWNLAQIGWSSSFHLVTTFHVKAFWQQTTHSKKNIGTIIND